MRVFGSIGYVHVPNETRRKLDDKSEKLVFVGYAENSKGYKFYNPQNGKTIISRDVKFDEEGSWEWNISQDESYNFLPLFDESLVVDQLQTKDVSTTSASQTSLRATQIDQAVSSSPSSSDRPPHMRSVAEIYEETEEVNDSTLFFLFVDAEPISFEDVVQDEKWRMAMNEEIKAIRRNDTWELANLPKGKKLIVVKWIYKTKKNSKGDVKKYEAPLVAKGFTQKSRIDYDEVFAPVARLEIIRLIIALATQQRWKLYLMDVKSDFLNGVLEEEVYVNQPQGYIIE